MEFVPSHLFILQIFIKSLLPRDWGDDTNQDIHCLAFRRIYSLMAGRESINENVKYLKSSFSHLSHCRHLFDASHFLLFYFSEWANAFSQCIQLSAWNADTSGE